MLDFTEEEAGQLLDWLGGYHSEGFAGHEDFALGIKICENFPNDLDMAERHQRIQQWKQEDLDRLA